MWLFPSSQTKLIAQSIIAVLIKIGEILIVCLRVNNSFHGAYTPVTHWVSLNCLCRKWYHVNKACHWRIQINEANSALNASLKLCQNVTWYACWDGWRGWKATNTIFVDILISCFSLTSLSKRQVVVSEVRVKAFFYVIKTMSDTKTNSINFTFPSNAQWLLMAGIGYNLIKSRQFFPFNSTKLKSRTRVGSDSYGGLSCDSCEAICSENHFLFAFHFSFYYCKMFL